MSRRSQVKRVHIDGEEWTYQVGTSTVSIRNPDGKRVHVPRHEIEGPHDDWPTPGIVKNYIWRKLRPGNLIKVPGDVDQAKEIILNYFLGDHVEAQPTCIGKDGRRRFAGA